MDEVIYEEFKGTGNRELQLERKSVEERIYPAINIRGSGTSREDTMFDEQSLQRLWIVRRLLTEMEDEQSIEFLLDMLRQTKTNDEFFDNMRGGGKSS